MTDALETDAEFPHQFKVEAKALLALIGAVAVTTAVWFDAGIATAFDLGPLTHHMGLHILLMNAAAPLIAFAFVSTRGFALERFRTLVVTTSLQVLGLWAWHTPALIASAHASIIVMLVMHVSLFAVAIVFWIAVFGTNLHNRWQSIVALLLTGKLFCLLAALLTFSPRPLYPLIAGHGGHVLTSAELLADQQLAGLLMIVACPLTYVLAGVVIAARWLSDIEQRPAANHHTVSDPQVTA
jgi:putative membrane protein